MPRYLDELIETAEAPANALFHVAVLDGAVRRDRKISKANLTAGLGVPTTVATKYRFKGDGSFQLWNPDQNKWHTLTVSGAAGAEGLNVEAGEV